MNSIKSIGQVQRLQSSLIDLKKVRENKDVPSFQDTLKEVINEVNDQQHNAKETIEKFLKGEITDVHEVMIAGEKAGISLELTLAVRNKLLDAYRQIMRMQ